MWNWVFIMKIIYFLMYITQVLSIIFLVNVKYLELQYSIDGIWTFSKTNTASIYLPLAKTVYLQIIMV